MKIKIRTMNLTELLHSLPRMSTLGTPLARLSSSVCWPKPDYGPTEVIRSNFLNGLRVAAAKPLGAQISACTIMFQAGSRLEVGDQLGATHFIRAGTIGSGSGYSGFMRIRYLQEQGAYITCSSDRQSVAFTLRCPAPSFGSLSCHLIDVACRTLYRQIDLKDKVKPLVEDDLVRIPPEQHVIDLVQKACWGGPLNNSVYCAPGRVGDMTQEILEDYTRMYFTSNLCTIGSVGLPHEEVIKLAEYIECGKVDRPPDPCQWPSFPRAGFETCDLGAGSETWIAVAVPGCGTYDLDCLTRHSMLAAAIGTGNIMTGTHEFNHIPHGPLGAMATECFTSFKAFNVSYCDTGVFGIVVRTSAEMASHATLAAVEFMSNIHEVTCEQIEVGRKRLKVNLSGHDDSCTRVSEGLALQLASGHQLDSSRDVMRVVDSIYADQVLCVAKEIAAKPKRGFRVVNVASLNASVNNFVALPTTLGKIGVAKWQSQL